MLCGKPVVINPIGGLTEQIKDEITGFHVNCYDIITLSSKLDELASWSTGDLHVMGKRAHDFASSHYNLENQANKLAAIYDKLI